MDSSEVVDAVVSVVERRIGLKEAVDMYDSEMIPRGQKEVEMSYEAARISQRLDDVPESYMYNLNKDSSVSEKMTNGTRGTGWE